jgi:MAF protein
MIKRSLLPIVLASASPARKILLDRLQLSFICHPADIDETPHKNESIDDLVLRLSQEKAQALTKLYPNSLIIGADLIGILNNTFLGKPGSFDAGVAQLKKMSGQICEFWCGLALLNTQTHRLRTYREKVSVHMRNLTRSEIENYLQTEPAYHCAGSFQIESRGISLVKRIDNQDPSTLIGLPLIKLCEFLQEEGVCV